MNGRLLMQLTTVHLVRAILAVVDAVADIVDVDALASGAVEEPLTTVSLHALCRGKGVIKGANFFVRCPPTPIYI